MELSGLAGHPLAAWTRLLLMAYLAGRRRCTVKELAEALGIAPGTVEAHLKKLEEQGFLRKRKVLDGGRVAVIVVPTERGREAVVEYVQRLRGLLDAVVEEGGIYSPT